MTIRKALEVCYGVLLKELKLQCNIILVWCLIALSLDPLFCYILVVNEKKKCLRLDRNLGIVAIVSRSVIDMFYICHIILKVQDNIVTLSSQASEEGESVRQLTRVKSADRLSVASAEGESVPDTTRALAVRYLLLCLPLDILQVLPLPQVLILYVIPKLNDPSVFNATNSLNIVFIIQYVLRVVRIFSLLNKVTRTSGILAESTLINLCFCMLTSHVVGAFWYLFSIERISACWQGACKNYAGSYSCSLFCDDKFEASTSRNNSCSSTSASFKFGIYSDALESGVMSSDFVQRISYCFWWGLQNLSSLGQSLKTSTYVWEIYFSVFISISGLVLFAFLIGNMQSYLLSRVAKSEKLRLDEKLKEEQIARMAELRAKLQETGLWMSSHSFPRELKKRIWQYQKYKGREAKGIDVEEFLQNLPRDLKRDTKRHLCSGPLNKLRMLQNMDKRLLDAICDHLKPVLYIEQSFISRQGDPLNEMLLITRGKVLTYTTDASGNAECLEKKDLYGQELMDWAVQTFSTPTLSNLPFSTKTVQALTKVEVFALSADELKYIVSKFWWLFQADLHSSACKPRAAHALQAAWRRYKRVKSPSPSGSWHHGNAVSEDKEEHSEQPKVAHFLQAAWGRHKREKRHQKSRQLWDNKGSPSSPDHAV